MKYDSWFDADENKVLLAICARKLISNIGIGAIIWGLINIGIGLVAMQEALVNVGILILGVIMLATGVAALKAPSLRVLLTETIVTVLLLAWNVGISALNLIVFGVVEPQGLIFPLIIAIVFFNNYRKLQHVREQISSVQPQEVKDIKRICKVLLKKKLKEEPSIIQAANRRTRAQLMDDKAFFIQRDLMRAFVASRDNIRNAIVNPDSRSLTMKFNHPLGQLKYKFDKNSSEKIRNWLSPAEPSTTS